MNTTINTTIAKLTGSIDGPASSTPRPISERFATALVTLIFVINVAFLFYMLAQFFQLNPDTVSAHVAYTLIVLFNTVLLAYSTRFLWTRRTKAGCYAFFAAIIVSGIANVVVEFVAT